MTAPHEIEVKFVVLDPRTLVKQLANIGFYCKTRSTHEVNTLYDLPGQNLRRQGQLLRLRRYGDTWRLTHKSRARVARHKSRIELETAISDGPQMDKILRALGYQPVFVYEKFRAEWTDGRGHVVLDQTPIGDVAEIEGTARWIDATAKLLGVRPADYVNKSYAELFFEWKRKTNRKAKNMTFRECGSRAKTASKALDRVPRKPKPAPEFRPRRA